MYFSPEAIDAALEALKLIRPEERARNSDQWAKRHDAFDAPADQQREHGERHAEYGEAMR